MEPTVGRDAIKQRLITLGGGKKKGPIKVKSTAPSVACMRGNVNMKRRDRN